MRTKDLNFLRMTGAVRKVLDRYEGQWQGISRFAGYVADFKVGAEQLGKTVTDAEIETTGATEDKRSAGMKAVALGVKLAKRASIYAIENGDMQLHDQLRISRSALLSWHDKEAIAKLKDVLKRMEAAGHGLEDFLVAKKDLKKLHALIEDFSERESDPRNLTVERKSHNDSIPGQLVLMRRLLYKMDSMINIFEDSPFEAEYLLARKVIDLGRHDSKGDNERKV